MNARFANLFIVVMFGISTVVMGSLIVGCRGSMVEHHASTAHSVSRESAASTHDQDTPIICNDWDLANTPHYRLALPISNEKENAQSILQLVDIHESKYYIRTTLKGAEQPAWTKDGQNVAFSVETGRVHWPNFPYKRIGVYSWSSGKKLMLSGSWADSYPAWDTSGRMLAFGRTDLSRVEKGEGDSWAAIAEGFDTKPIIQNRSACGLSYLEAIRWKPNYSEFAFIGEVFDAMPNTREGGKADWDVYLYKVGAKKPFRLTHSGNVIKYSLSWSPDGKYLAYATGKTRFESFCVLDVIRRKSKIILKPSSKIWKPESSVANIQWSPNGRYIVFDAPRFQPGVNANIGIVEWPSCRLKWLSHDGRSRAPRWAADSRRVLYIRNNNEIWETHIDSNKKRKVFSLLQLPGK